MGGAVITISPRVHVDELERLACARLARDGVVELAAATGDQRQMRHLEKLAHRLVDPDRMVIAHHGQDGATYVTVLPAGLDHAVWWSGDPKVR